MHKAFKKFAKKDARNGAEELKRLVKESFDGMDFDLEENEDAEMGKDGDSEGIDLDTALDELSKFSESIDLDEDDDKGITDAQIDAWLSEGMESDEDEMGMPDDLNEESESDLEKEVQAMLDKLKSDAEMAKGGEDLEEEYDSIMDEAEELEDSIHDDILDEIRQVYEMEMEENSSVSYQNEKGMNAKPDDYEYKDLYNESIKRSRALAKENRELKAKLAKAESEYGKVYESASKLVVYNDNMANIINLFVENALTKKEKEAILEKYYSKDPKTSKDSKSLTEAIQKGLDKRNEALLKEGKAKNPDIKANKPANIAEAKETKSFIEPSMNRALNLMRYKHKK